MTFLIQSFQPSSIRDFECKDNFVELLEDFIEIDMLNILLVGTSCTGKTSLIELIVAKYYGNRNSHGNILRIHSLFDQGVQYLRNEVKGFCQTYSTIKNKKKIIIIDDIDNVPEQSQQVLRNCMDKYSKEICFLLSCTDITKVTESIQSKEFIMKLNPFTDEILTKMARRITHTRNIMIDDNALVYMIQLTKGSPRTLFGFLDQLQISGEKGTVLSIQKMCSNIDHNYFYKYHKYIYSNKLQLAIDVLYCLYDLGYSVMDIMSEYFEFIKILNYMDEEIRYRIIKCVTSTIVNYHEKHEDPIELAFFTSRNLSIIRETNPK